MNRLASTFALVLLANSLFAINANACNGAGGIRIPTRSYGGRYVVNRPVVVHRPVVRTVRTVRVAAPPRVVQVPAARPQIRLAPTQRRNLVVPAASDSAALATQQTAPQTAPQTADIAGNQTVPNQNAASQNAASQNAASQNTGSTNALAILSGQVPQSSSELPAEPSTPASASTPSHIGTWTAQANAQATVTLSLSEDSSFEWVATSNGKTSRFGGKFELFGQKLTLARSSDNQKLGGTISFSDTGFNFKLDGSKDAGLDFSPRS